MADFEKLAATAQRLVEKNGRAMQLIRHNRTAADPTKPWRGNVATPTTGAGGDPGLDAIACFVPASGSGLGRLFQQTAGTLAVAFEQIGLVASGSIADADLSTYDRVIDEDGTSWKIEVRGELKPGSKSLLWFLGLKR
jgi:hypothetical protein